MDVGTSSSSRAGNRAKHSPPRRSSLPAARPFQERTRRGTPETHDMQEVTATSADSRTKVTPIPRFQRALSLSERPTALRRVSWGASLSRLLQSAARTEDDTEQKLRAASYREMIALFQLRKAATPPPVAGREGSTSDSARSASAIPRPKLSKRGSCEREGASSVDRNDQILADFANDGGAAASGATPPLPAAPETVPQPGESEKHPVHATKVRPSLSRSAWRVGRRLKRRLRRLLSPWTPTSQISKARWIMLVFAFAVQVVYLPLVPVYFPDGNATIARLSRTLQAVFLFDVLLKFNSSYFDMGKLMMVTSRREIALRYVSGWFIPDILAAIPLDWIQRQSHLGDMTAVHILLQGLLWVPRLIHTWSLLHRLGWSKEIQRWLLYSRYSHLMRIVRMILLVVLTAHCIACGWHLVTGDDPNAPNAVPPGSSVWDQYVSDLYYAVLLIQGQGVSSGGTTSQNLFSVVAVLVGSIVLAIVFGNVAMLVANFNANSTSHQRKMEAVFATMNKLRLPQDLRDRIHQYYEYVWHEYESLDGDVVKFSKELTHTLALEVGLYRHMDLVMNVPFWRGCSPDFVKQLVLSLSVRVYLPDDYVVRVGEVGTEMYLVNCGTCEWVDDDTGRLGRSSSERSHRLQLSEEPLTARFFQLPLEGDTSRTPRKEACMHSSRSRRSSLSTTFGIGVGSGDGGLHPDERLQAKSSFTQSTAPPPSKQPIVPGDSFGELSLVLNYRCTTTVRAATYVEMCILSRCHFQTLLVRYPDDRSIVLRAMLSASATNREFPLDLSHFCSDFSSEHGFTSEAVVEALLNHMDHPASDNTIVFGLQPHIQEATTACPAHSDDENVSDAERVPDLVDRVANLEEQLAECMSAMKHQQSLTANMLRTISDQLSALAPPSADASLPLVDPASTLLTGEISTQTQ